MFNFFKKKKLQFNKPKFLIIGAQKAGTTALYEYLNLHPTILSPQKKELHFFSCNKIYNLGIDHYHSLFPKNKINTITFEASPSYLVAPQSCERIYQYNKDMKIIVLLRDPVERAYSAWNMYIKRYEKNIDWFFDGWAKSCNTREEKSMIQRRDKNNIFDFYSFIKEELDFISNNGPDAVIESPVLMHGTYSTYIKKYYDYFPKENIMIIENDELNTHTIDILQNIQKFLDIPEYDWKSENLEKRFQGQYQSKIDNESKKLLSSYYSSHNKELFNFIQKNYDW